MFNANLIEHIISRIKGIHMMMLWFSIIMMGICFFVKPIDVNAASNKLEVLPVQANITNDEFHINPSTTTSNDFYNFGRFKIEDTRFGTSNENLNIVSQSQVWNKPIYRINIPSNYQNDWNDSTTIMFKNGATYRGRGVDVLMSIHHINLYSREKGDGIHYIDVLKDFSLGFFYHGITSLNVVYTFLDSRTKQRIRIGEGKTYLTANSLNGITGDLGRLSDGITGEWVNYLNGGGSSIGYITQRSGIGTYYSKVEHGFVNGGLINTSFHDYLGSDDFYTHSISYRADSSELHAFRFGAGYGSAWATLSTDTIKNPVDHKVPTPNTSLNKSVSRPILTAQNQRLTYTITGKFPDKRKDHKVIEKQIPWANGEVQIKKVDEYYNKNDYLEIIDNVPKDVTVLGASANGFQVSQNGNRIRLYADNKRLIANSNRTWRLTIDCIANRLPQPTSNGWRDNPRNKGWYTFYNQASLTGKISNINRSGTSNRVPVKIKRIQGNVYHYDFDNRENGDFDFLNHSNNNNNFSYNKNFNPSKGVLKKETVYGYQGDKKPVYMLNNAYKNNNREWRYIYGYGQKNSEMVTLGPGIGTNTFDQNFYFPYIVPRAKVKNVMVKVDTNKAKDNLPFILDMSGESFLYREFSNYDGASLNVSIVQPNTGQNLFSKSIPLKNFLRNGHHGIGWTQIKGELLTSESSRYKPGDKVPLEVRISSTNPRLIQQDYPKSTSTFGFVATEHYSNEKGFKGKTNEYIAPERTIKYDGVNQVRILREQMVLTQERQASAKTGYGIRGDLRLSYKGNLHPKRYLDQGTDMNFVFPEEYASENNEIAYDADPQSHVFKGKVMLADRFDKKKNYKLGFNPHKGLDDYYTMGSSNRNQIDKIEKNVPSFYNDENYSSFDVDYQFAPRVSAYDDGTVYLKDNQNELARNKNKYISDNFRYGGNKFFTPYWMKLGKYDSVYSKSYYSNTDKGRLGGNWLNVDDMRPIDFYAHMYLADNTTSEQDDELSLQPIISGEQIPKDFNTKNKQWLYNY